jgi:DNA primase
MKLNLQQLKQIVRIADYLKTEEKEKDFFIHSPFRAEKTPSFKINPALNTWFDFGLGEGGTILDLIMKLENKDTKQAVKRLKELAGDTTTTNSNHFFSFPQQNTFNNQLNNKIIDYEIRELNNKALLDYLQDRKIDYRASQGYLKEIYYKVRDKTYFGLAFKNNSGGYEIRNKYFKGAVGTKDITTIMNAEEKKKECVVFEGFMDFLSYLTIKPNTGKDFIILNSVALTDKAIEVIKQYNDVKLALDNDQAGNIATQKIIEHIPGAIDVRGYYKGFKDLNEFIMMK